MSLLLQLFLMFIVAPLVIFGGIGIFIVLMLRNSDNRMQRLSDTYKANPDLVREQLAFRLGK